MVSVLYERVNKCRRILFGVDKMKLVRIALIRVETVAHPRLPPTITTRCRSPPNAVDNHSIDA